MQAHIMRASMDLCTQTKHDYVYVGSIIEGKILLCEINPIFTYKSIDRLMDSWSLQISAILSVKERIGKLENFRP